MREKRDMKSTFSARYRGAALCAIAIVAIFMASCNEAPNEVGSDMPTDTVNAVTITSLSTPIFTTDSTIYDPTFNYNQGFLHIGSTPTYKATTILRFVNLPDTMRTITAQQIESATLLMKPRRYVFGDSVTNQLAFDVVRLTKPFVENDTGNTIKFVPRWNDLFNTDGTPKSDYFSPTPVATFSGNIPLDSALPDLEIPLNDEGKNLLAEWLRNNTDTTLRKQIYGIGFVPKLTSTVVRQFSTGISNGTLPFIRMRVYYRNGSGARDSFLLQSGNDLTFANTPPLSSEFYSLQSLVRRRVRMYFDVSSIPKLNSITSAQLILTVDTTRHLVGNIKLANDTGNFHVMKLNYFSSRRTAGYFGRRQPGSDKVIFPNVPRVVEGALYDDNGKGYFTIDPVNEVGCEQMAIYNFTATDSTKRPKLVITHISRPTFGGKK